MRIARGGKHLKKKLPCIADLQDFRELASIYGIYKDLRGFTWNYVKLHGLK